MERRCWVNFQCLGILLVWIIVGQGPIALAVGAGGGCLDIFSLIYLFSFLSPSLWETARYRLKYCLKGPLNPKQPTNQLILSLFLQTCFEMSSFLTTEILAICNFQFLLSVNQILIRFLNSSASRFQIFIQKIVCSRILCNLPYLQGRM